MGWPADLGHGEARRIVKVETSEYTRSPGPIKITLTHNEYIYLRVLLCRIGYIKQFPRSLKDIAEMLRDELIAATSEEAQS